MNKEERVIAIEKEILSFEITGFKLLVAYKCIKCGCVFDDLREIETHIRNC